jgi:hypothetical protein
MPKQTAAQRAAERAQAEQEALDRETAWQACKHERLIQALAQAHNLNMPAQVYMRYSDVVYYHFRFEDVTYSDPVAELSEHMMSVIEQALMEIKQARERKQALRQVYDDLMQELTPEQQEALRTFQ